MGYEIEGLFPEIPRPPRPRQLFEEFDVYGIAAAEAERLSNERGYHIRGQGTLLAVNFTTGELLPPEELL